MKDGREVGEGSRRPPHCFRSPKRSAGARGSRLHLGPTSVISFSNQNFIGFETFASLPLAYGMKISSASKLSPRFRYASLATPPTLSQSFH